jgi:hypothetical protein
MRAPRGGPVVARPSMHALRLSTICGKGPTPLPSARGDENSREAERRNLRRPYLSKGFFWLSRPRIRSSRSCWWVGMDVRFVCVICVPVSRVNVNTTDATTGATALESRPALVMCKKSHRHTFAFTHTHSHHGGYRAGACPGSPSCTRREKSTRRPAPIHLTRVNPFFSHE